MMDLDSAQRVFKVVGLRLREENIEKVSQMDMGPVAVITPAQSDYTELVIAALKSKLTPACDSSKQNL